MWLLSPQGNRRWIKYNQIQTVYPVERCLMEVTQQRAKVERRKRSEVPRAMAVGLLLDPTFLKSHTCSICVSSYLSLTCARVRSRSLPTSLPWTLGPPAPWQPNVRMECNLKCPPPPGPLPSEPLTAWTLMRAWLPEQSRHAETCPWSGRCSQRPGVPAALL